MTTAKEVLKQAKGLPTLSGVVARLAQLCNNAKARASDFEEVIVPDPALTANLLRLANSPFFGARREITSVRQAVTLLGIERVFEVAISASFSQALPERIPGFNISSENFFQHSFVVGGMSERLAAKYRVQTGESVFTAGLLHDIGKLAIGSLLYSASDELNRELKTDDIPFIDSEKSILGTNHAEVGELMVEAWDLPPLIGIAARFHHYPDELEDENARKITDVIHVADGLAHMIGFGADVGELKRIFNSNSMKRLGVKVTDLETVALEMTHQIVEMGDIFGGHR